MSRWNQPICERDWIDQRGMWEPQPDGTEVLVAIALPVRVKEPELERCSYCGLPTIFGAYVRADPATVPYPPVADVAAGRPRRLREPEGALAAVIETIERWRSGDALALNITGDEPAAFEKNWNALTVPYAEVLDLLRVASEPGEPEGAQGQ